MDSGAECIEGKLANGDSHATEAEVAQTKDAFAIGDDNDTHIAMPDACARCRRSQRRCG